MKKNPTKGKTRLSKLFQWIGGLPPFKRWRNRGKGKNKVEKISVPWTERFSATSQYVLDRQRHIAKKKARNRRNRKAARALHQKERRRAK
jgi:hypothetical protein